MLHVWVATAMEMGDGVDDSDGKVKGGEDVKMIMRRERQYASGGRDDCRHKRAETLLVCMSRVV